MNIALLAAAIRRASSDPVLSGGWTALRSGGLARLNHSVSALGSLIYIFGGDVPSVGRTKKLHSYNPQSDLYTLYPDPPTAMVARRAASMVAIDGKLYILGGFSTAAMLADLWEYDTTAQPPRWTQRASCPIPLNGHQAAVHNGKMYVYGGFGVVSGSNQRLNTLYEYSPSSNSWRSLAAGPLAVNQHCAQVIGEGLYVFGGSPGVPAVSPDLFMYNFLAPGWITLAKGPKARRSAVSGVINNKLFIAGGTDEAGVVLNDVWVYDPATNKWTELLPLPAARTASAAAVLGNRFYVHGGADESGSGLDTMLSFGL